MKHFLKSINIFLISLFLAILYVPIRLEGVSLTFWIFILDFKSLGDKGVLWHFGKVAKEIDIRYFLLQAVSAYFLCRFCIFIVAVLSKKNLKNRLQKSGATMR